MGSSQSSHADKHGTKSVKHSSPEGVRGRKSRSIQNKGTTTVPHLRASVVSLESHELTTATAEENLHEEDDVHPHPAPSLDDHVFDSDVELVSSDDEDEDEFESGDEEGDDEWEERLLILEEARKMKQIAEFFLHPEQPMFSNTSARCYFKRASAPLQMSKEEADEEAAILEDVSALKKFAVDYLHPEKCVKTVDATACGRNYFSRPSAPEYETEVDMEERDLVMADMQALKKSAGHFLHPERPVAVDAVSCGRNYFSRPSAPEYESEVDMEEHDQVMADLKALKQSAVQHLHPEKPLEATDATVLGRNYFTRVSAPEFEDPEEVELRAQVLEDLKLLKKAAMDYLHPELPVKVDSAVFGRNYFSRPSAPEYESEVDMEERDQVMADMQALKQSASHFLHPERHVTVDAASCGRNYFTRASAPEYDDEEAADLREQILEDARVFKQIACDYLHPELPVVIYSTAKGRNFFSRSSAPEYESLEDTESRAQVMEDMRAFKEIAVDFLHPELPAVVYATATGRNFFKRPSSAPIESLEEAEERARIMADLKSLKQSAVDFLHPERPVNSTDPGASGRNYFSRPSASIVEVEPEYSEKILTDLQALKHSAVNYMHPELPVTTTDPFACGRNYFSRPSAPTGEEEVERQSIMADLHALKQSAVNYMHPELPVKTTDPFACGRDYFSRPSAPTGEEEEERQSIMADLHALKQSAVNYMHPELPVKTTDPFACGRNYFSRQSAAESEDPEQVKERDRILEEAEALKYWATEFLHPECPVVTSAANATGRNYYARPSSIVHDHMIHTFPVHEDEHTDHHSEHLDHFGMDEELEFMMFDDMRHDLAPAAAYEQEKPAKGAAGSEEEGKLSRSPSSVMLAFDESVY